MMIIRTCGAVPARDRWGQQRLACRQIQAEGERGKKEKENAIKDKTLSKQASAKIQEEGKSMRGAKEEAEQENRVKSNNKRRKQEMKNKD